MSQPSRTKSTRPTRQESFLEKLLIFECKSLRFLDDTVVKLWLVAFRPIIVKNHPELIRRPDLLTEHPEILALDLVSAVSGELMEPSISEIRRKARIQLGTLLLYPMVALFLLLGIGSLPEPPLPPTQLMLPNLIFVAEPGPGGGGGGSGESEDPAQVRKEEGTDRAQIAIEVEKPEQELFFADPDKPILPENNNEDIEEENKSQAVIAPVMAMAPDDAAQEGILEEQEQLGATGSGTGTGIGQGEGAGIGEGHGGGFGGGAYRMGSGVTPPGLLRRVDPRYTDEALARKIEGTVVLEVVILKEGRVGEIRVLRSLDPMLDQKAIEAVRQWLFSPAKLQGKEVDVVAEIEVAFSLL